MTGRSAASGRSETPTSSGGAIGKAINYGRRLLQPRYWPQMGRLLMRRITNEPLDQHTGAEARRRSEEMAIGVEEAFARLGLSPDSLASFAGDHAAVVAASRDRIARANGTMGGGADVDLLYALCLASGAIRVLETGVAYGWSSLAILAAIASRPGARLVSVDLPYLGANKDHLVGLAVPKELRPNWTLIRGADREQLGSAIGMIRPADLIHYDSDKSYLGRQWAYPQLWAALRPGGLLVSDDIDDNMAFLHFAERIGEKAIVLRTAGRTNYLGVLRRPA